MRLRRGTTLAGLRGIQALRQAQGPFIYRPFLNVSREELLAYARENGLEWCEDESNVDVKFARNKIRHVFLPHLEENCPGATQQLCRIAEIADKVYEKVLNRCNTLFSVTVEACKTDRVRGDNSYEDITESIEAKPLWMTIAKGDPGTLRLRSGQAPAGMTSFIALDKKKLNKIFAAHKNADLSELFRLWLSELGFRFPTGFFYAPKEPAHIKIPIRASYRKRSIVKIRHTVWICEFKDTESALKFVSCEMKEKGLYE
jgi:tRNA(Ile)-lysidine synthase